MKPSKFQKILNRLPISKRQKGKRSVLYAIRDFHKKNRVTIISQEIIELDKVNIFVSFEVINK